MNHIHYLHIDKHINENVIIGFGLLKLKQQQQQKKNLQELSESLQT